MPSFWTRLVAEMQMREIDAWVDSRSLRNPSASCRGKGCKCGASRIHPPPVHHTCHKDDQHSQRDIRVRPFPPVVDCLGLYTVLDPRMLADTCGQVVVAPTAMVVVGGMRGLSS